MTAAERETGSAGELSSICQTRSRLPERSAAPRDDAPRSCRAPAAPLGSRAARWLTLRPWALARAAARFGRAQRAFCRSLPPGEAQAGSGGAGGRGCRGGLPRSRAAALGCWVRAIAAPQSHSPLGAEGKLPSRLRRVLSAPLALVATARAGIGSFCLGGGWVWGFFPLTFCKKPTPFAFLLRAACACVRAAAVVFNQKSRASGGGDPVC